MDKEDIETCLEFMYNKCLNCSYKEECKHKKENIEQIETGLQNLKNEKINELKEITGITF